MDVAGHGGPPPGMVEDDGYITVAEAAFEAGVSRQTVHDWIRRGHLVAAKSADGAILIEREELQRFSGIRRMAKSTHVRVDTVRHWAGEAGEGEPTGGTLGGATPAPGQATGDPSPP